MKTKIIYISGNELFEMADIRAAFEEVRSALALGPDTVLFGVPVDAEDAIAEVAEKEPEAVIEQPVIVEAPVVPEESVVEPVIVEKPKRVRKTKKVEIESETVEEKQTEPVAETEAPVIPILSFLGNKTEVKPAAEEQPEPVIEEEPEAVVQPPVITTTTVTSISIEEIEESVTDDIPSKPVEKTLEQLLGEIAPLHEDKEEIKTKPAKEPVIEETVSEDKAIDLTLEQLAAEFIEKQDEIIASENSGNNGKIGKLKNILPFKKAKREDPGLMGDLFGWAGIAANDDEFAMPGFFTTNASKK